MSRPARRGPRAACTSPSHPDIARIRERLGQLIELSFLSHREIASRLCKEGRGTDLGRLLSGRLQLQVRHVLDICRVIGLHPLDFFRLVLPAPAEPSPLLRRLDAVTGARRPAAATGASSPGASDLLEIRRQLSEILRLLGAERPTPPGDDTGPSRLAARRADDPRAGPPPGDDRQQAHERSRVGEAPGGRVSS